MTWDDLVIFVSDNEYTVRRILFNWTSYFIIIFLTNLLLHGKLLYTQFGVIVSELAVSTVDRNHFFIDELWNVYTKFMAFY